MTERGRADLGAIWRSIAIALPLAITSIAAPALAVTSSRSVPSLFGGNGHNASFDGRLFLVRDSEGWQARLLRPEGATFLPDGMPDTMGPIWSDKATVLGPSDVAENALAICEPSAADVPFACDDSGAPAAAGPFACYSVWILDSDAVHPVDQGGAVLRRRHLLLWVAQPKSADAQIAKFAWDGAVEPLSPTILGIEPTITADGKLLVYQGHPANDGTIDILMYAVNTDPCSATGWSKPEPLSHMFADPAVTGTYALAERKLRAADGTVFEDGNLVHGAYPWLLPNGDAVVFAAAPMPCKGPEDPPGCGPRRNALSVVGYPTNWGVAVIDGGVNPDTDQTVRLFFSSPGPDTFPNLPVTAGKDVWPFFGSNTSNYVELVFDDGLDGNYAGFWHLNESVDHEGNLDTTRTPDVSGYFNTGALLGGLGFSTKNDGVIGKALSFDGVDDRIEVPNAQSLNPVNGITIEMSISPTSPDCDDKNNYRLLLGKGGIGDGSYTIVLEENLALQARVNVGGVEQAIASPGLAPGAWTHVAFEYDGASGKAGFWFDDQPVASADLAPGTISPTSYPLTIGAPGPRAACPDGDGAFAGQLDEIAISRYARHLGEPPVGTGTGGGSASSGATGDVSGTGSGASSGAGGAPGVGGTAAGLDDDPSSGTEGCGCGTSRSITAPASLLVLLALGAMRGGRRSRRRLR